MEDDIFSTVLSLHDAAPGTLIASRYRIISLLGKGGQAAVYKVADTQDNNRELALKLFSWENLGRTTEREHALARFSREYKVLSQLSHPNIVQVYDFKELHEACCFFVMECISGGSVSERIKDANNPILLPEILKILLGAAKALQFAHANGIIHRDLKPGNILLTAGGEAKIVDFGLARPVSKGHTITDAGAALGTPAYMSPEQLRGESVDHRTDIYALGIIAFEMFARKCPFEGETYQIVAFKHHAQDLPPIAAPDGSAAPKWYQRFIEYCTEKKKEERMESMDDVAATLEERMRKLGLMPEDPLQKTPLISRILDRLFGDF